MPVDYKREMIGEGIGLSVIRDKKFKTNMISVNFMTKLSKETASVNALIPNVLITSNKNCPDRTELSQKLASLYGTSLGCSVSKRGDVQTVNLNASCILDKYALEGEKLTEETAKILLDCILEPVLEDGGFDKKEFALRKQELLDQQDSLINEKRSYAIKQAYEIVFENEPFAVSSFGTRETAEGLTPVSSYEAYLKLLETAGIEISVVGGGDLDEAVELVKQGFSKIKRNYTDDLSFNSFSKLKSECKNASEPIDVNQCKMVMAYKSDFDNIYVAKFFSAVLGGTAFSKLFTNVREKMSLCYYCAARIIEGKGTLVIDSGVDIKNIELARKAINEQIVDIANGNISDELIENTRLSIIGEAYSSFDTLWGISNWYLNMLIRGDNYTVEEFVEIEKSITKEQIVECAKSFKLDTVYILESKQGGNV